MKKVVLDLVQMSGIPQAHAYLQKVLALPDYYGGNLDALYDCLSTYPEQLVLEVPQEIVEDKYLGDYGQNLLQVLKDAAEENGHLQIISK